MWWKWFEHTFPLLKPNGLEHRKWVFKPLLLFVKCCVCIHLQESIVPYTLKICINYDWLIHLGIVWLDWYLQASFLLEKARPFWAFSPHRYLHLVPGWHYLGYVQNKSSYNCGLQSGESRSVAREQPGILRASFSAPTVASHCCLLLLLDSAYEAASLILQSAAIFSDLRSHETARSHQGQLCMTSGSQLPHQFPGNFVFLYDWSPYHLLKTLV